MKSMGLKLVMVALMAGVVLWMGCPDNGNGGNGGQYFLNVSVGEGVTGTPTTGAYSYNAGDSVSYAYSAQAGYSGLTVQLDGTTIAAAGTITILNNHTLTATAGSYDVRGDWEGGLTDANNTDPFEITFTGSSGSSGTTSGGITGGPVGSGTFTTSGNVVNFTCVLTFGSWSFTGTMTTKNHMEGTWTWSNDPGNTWTFVLDRV